jgi:hypothetical protein
MKRLSGKNLFISIIRLELRVIQIIAITGAVDKYVVKFFMIKIFYLIFISYVTFNFILHSDIDYLL